MKSGQGGQCPACGSFNLKVQDAKPEEQEPPPRWRLALLASLWATLLLMIAWKLIN